MLWLLEFTRDGHRYRAELRPDPATSDEPSRPIARAFWFVSMDGNAPHIAFEADVRDEDTEEFRRRVVSAALGEIRGQAAAPNEQRPGDPGSDQDAEPPQDQPRHRS